MNQDEINQAEWNNRENWSLFVYHSQRDTRMWVPKRFGFGWTINLRNKTGARWFAGLLLTVATVGLLTAITVGVIFHKR
jgi:uncharacterized membrane protein